VTASVFRNFIEVSSLVFSVHELWDTAYLDSFYTEPSETVCPLVGRTANPSEEKDFAVNIKCEEFQHISIR